MKKCILIKYRVSQTSDKVLTLPYLKRYKKYKMEYNGNVKYHLKLCLKRAITLNYNKVQLWLLILKKNMQKNIIKKWEFNFKYKFDFVFYQFQNNDQKSRSNDV